MIIYSDHADQPEYKLPAEGEKPDMLLPKGDVGDRDALTMVVGYALKRLALFNSEQGTLVSQLQALEAQQRALKAEHASFIFLIRAVGIYGIVWASGVVILKILMLPGLNLFGWIATWTIISLVAGVSGAAHLGRKTHQVHEADLFKVFLDTKNLLLSLVVALILALLADIILKGVR